MSKVKSENQQDTTTLQKAVEELQEGSKALEFRQKLIRLADRSEFGWDAVKEYETDELAADDDDAKRLEKAEKAAEQKVMKRKRVAQLRGRGRGRRAQGFPTTYSQQLPGSSVVPVQQPPNVFQFRGNAGGSGQRPRVPGPCFNCTEMGHIRANCPKLSKTYPFDIHSNVCDGMLYSVNDVWVNETVCVNKKKGLSKDVCDSSEVMEVTCVNKVQDNSNACSCAADPKVTDGTMCCSEQKGCEVTTHTSESESEFLDCSDSGPDMHDISRFWELEQGGGQIQDVQGRLKESLAFWQDVLEAPGPIVECIRSGYKLPLLTLPPPFSKPNHRSALINADFVEGSIKELLENRCIHKVTTRPHICSPLSVVSNREGKKRLVLNLRYLNNFLRKERFKYEDIRVAISLFKKGDYVFTFDLKSGYHHVDIHQEHWKYLGFAWGVGSELSYYVFGVLPFGLATACYLFTKLLRPLVKHWRQQGLRVVIYLDDGIVAVEGEQAALIACRAVQDDLVKAGLVVHVIKSRLEPTQQCTWLGLDIDLARGCISVPEAKLNNLLSQVAQAVDSRSLQARVLASLIGKIISMSIAIGPVARLMTKNLYAILNSRQAWCDNLELSTDASSELQFWAQELPKFNGQDIWPSPSAIRVVYTDASQSGYGGYTVEHGYHIAQGQWSSEEAVQSSTWRELRAVRLVLESLVTKLANERVRWFTDNQNVCRVILCGSRKPNLHAEALAIFSISVANHIRIEPEWIPRANNHLADYLSRIVDYDDWYVDVSIFMRLEQLWGPHTVDRFASYYNTQLPRFNSRFWNPGAEAVDAFTCNWDRENNWLCPPVYLIPRVIGHAKKCCAVGTLVVPEWPSAPFWPLLYPNGKDPGPFITDTVVLHKQDIMLHPGRSGACLFRGPPNTNMIAVRLDFRASTASVN